jgi:hypothetical protein
MAKKSKASAATTTNNARASPQAIQFPEISLKEVGEIEVETLLDDQVILLHVSHNKPDVLHQQDTT